MINTKACVLFDLDETVLDRTASLQNFVQWQANSMLAEQLDDPDRFIEQFIRLDNGGKVWKNVVYRQLIDEFSIKHWTWEELLRSYELCFCAFCVPRPGIQAILEHLKNKKIAMGVVTNGYSPFQERNTRALPQSRFFDTIIVSDAVGLRKPDTAIFKLACSTLNCELSQSIFIGDNPIADIQGAKQAGMKTVYVPTQAITSQVAPTHLEKNKLDTSSADATVIDLFQLPKVVDELLGLV